MLTTTGLNLALKGHPVLLRNGSQAYIIADLRTLPEPREVLVVYVPKDDATHHVGINGLVHPDGDYYSRDIVSLPQPKRFNWDNIDPKWNAVAADSNGVVNLYTTTKLVLNHGAHDYGNDHGITHEDVTGILTLDYHTWETSQQSRPI